VRAILAMENGSLISLSLFPSAGRWEQEVWDMSGVSSINHPDLCCISTDSCAFFSFDFQLALLISQSIPNFSSTVVPLVQ